MASSTSKRPSANASVISIKSIDHIVLYVQSIEASVHFYTNHLGMRHEQFSSVANPDVQRHALTFGNQKINLHDVKSPFEPHARRPEDGTADLCFISDTPVEKVLEYFKEQRVEVLEGGKVVERTGAVGKLRSCYVFDPDGNLIEISNYE